MPAPPAEAALGTPALDAADRRVGDLPAGRSDARRARRAVPRDRDERDRRSASRTRTSPPMTASGARRRGRSWPAARGWSSTGTGTRSTSATRRTGSASSTTTASPAAATTRSSGSPASSTGPARRWPTSCPTPTSASSTRARASGRWSSIRRSPVEGGLEPDRGSYDAHLRRASTRACSAPACRPTSSTRRISAATPTRSWRAGRCSSCPRSTSPTTCCSTCSTPTRGAGGHLVLGFRSGYADDEARPRPEVMPGRLREAVGRELRRVHEPRRAGAAAVGRRLRPAPRCGRDGLGGRARAGGRRDARGLRRTRTSGAGRRSPPTSTAAGA